MHRTSKNSMRTWNMMNESRSLMWKMRTKKFRKQKVFVLLLRFLKILSGSLFSDADTFVPTRSSVAFLQCFDTVCCPTGRAYGL